MEMIVWEHSGIESIQAKVKCGDTLMVSLTDFDRSAPITTFYDQML